MRIEVHPEAREELLEFLRRANCITRVEDDGSVIVEVPDAHGEEQARLEAIRMLASTEAILLDPVYTAKAMAGLIDHVRRREVDPASTVVFLHTGGVPALFAHAASLF